MAERLKITKAGQVSVPARVRRRWNTSTVVAEDGGDHLVLRPVPDDPIEALVGVFEDQIRAGPSIEEARRQFREEEAEIEERKLKQYRKRIGRSDPV